MTKKHWFAGLAIGALVVGAALVTPTSASAHCDGRDGPVVKAAELALQKGDASLVLPWVRKQDEAEINRAFRHALAVRKTGSEAQKLADDYFYETLVRVHRTGEGEPYTGLKPAGRDLGPAIPAADRALDSGDPEPVVRLLGDELRAGVRERFQHALAARKAAKGDVEAGRKAVEEYVAFVHYVEGVHGAAAGEGGAHHHAEHPSP